MSHALTDSEVKQIGAYLTVACGSAKAAGAGVVAALSTFAPSDTSLARPIPPLTDTEAKAFAEFVLKQ